MRKKYLIYFLLLFFIFFFSANLYSSPTNLIKLNIYKNNLFSDSSIYSVKIGTQCYILADTNSPTPQTIPGDYFFVTVTHTSDLTDTITIKLTQDNYDSKLYKSDAVTIVNSGLSNSTLNYIGVLPNSGEIIKFFYKNIEYDSLYVTISTGPIELNNLNFMTSDYNSILNGNIPPVSLLYIEANGTDGNELTIDTITCICTSSADISGIPIILTETGEHTGKYRGTLQLNTFSNTQLGYINAYNNNDAIYISTIVNGIIRSDSIMIQFATEPTEIFNIDFKESNFSNSLTREILPTENIYIEALGQDGNSNTVDTLSVVLSNTTLYESIVITLIETNSNSGKYRGTAKLNDVSNQTQSLLKAQFNNIIIVYPISFSALQDTIQITLPSSPTEIESLKFKNSTWTNDLGNFTNSYVRLNIELTAVDINPYYPDTVIVSCTSTYDSIYIILTEISNNAGIFRGYIELNNFTYQTLNIIKAYQNGDTILIKSGMQSATITVMTTASPTNIISINVKTDATYSTNKTIEYTIDDDVYVEAVAEDLNSLTIDKLDLQAYASSNENDFINFTLTESENNTGKFRGKFKITSLSNDTLDELKANFGDTIYIQLRNSTDPTDTIYIKMTTPKSPVSFNILQFTTSDYKTKWSMFEQVNIGSNIYIQLTATDRNELTIDTFGVILYTLNTTDTTEYLFNLSLLETDKHTGIFHGWVKLDEINKIPALNQLKTKIASFIILAPGDTPVQNITPTVLENLIANSYDTIQTVQPKPPTEFLSINLKKSSDFSQIKYSPIMWTHENNQQVIIQEYLYIEIGANKFTSSNLIPDTVKILVQSTTEKNAGDTNIFELIETSNNSGIYRTGATQIQVVNYNNVGQVLFTNRIEVLPGDSVEITILDPTTLLPTPSIDSFKRSVANYISPTRLKKIDVYRDAQYSIPIANSLLSFENPYKYIYFEVEVYDIEGAGIEPFANDELEDTLELVLKSAIGYNRPDTITITLKETDVSSNIYRTYLTIPYILNETKTLSNELETSRGDTITIYGNTIGESAPIKLLVENYREPRAITSLQFYTDNSYNTVLSTDLLMEDYIYIQCQAVGSAEILVDTLMVTLYRNLRSDGTSDDTITILLKETAVGSEIYRISPDEATPQLYYYTRDSVNYLYANPSDIITISKFGDTTPYSYFVIGSSRPPAQLYNIRTSLSSNFTEYLAGASIIPLNTKIYVEAIGDVGNNATVDKVNIRIKNLNGTSGDTINIYLTETGKNTGFYRGSFQLAILTNNTLSELGVKKGDVLRIEISDSTSVYTDLIVAQTVLCGVGTLNNLNFMTSDFTNILAGNVSPNAIIYVEANGSDSSQYTLDTLTVTCTSTSDLSGIKIILTETGNNTGKYHGTFTLNTFTDDILDFLKVNSVDTVYISATNNTGSDTKINLIRIQPASTPAVITSLDLKTSDYSQSLTAEILPEAILYISVAAVDLNSTTCDTMNIKIKNISIDETLLITIFETSNNSGIFRGTASLGTVTNQTQKILKANFGNIIVVSPELNGAIQDTAFVTIPQKPASLDNLRFMMSDYSQELTGGVLPYSYLYIEANGSDGNSLTADTLTCSCSSSEDLSGITIILTETGKQTGKYRGWFQLNDFSDNNNGYLKGKNPETVISIYAVSNNKTDTKYTNITIKYSTSPKNITAVEFKDSGYQKRLSGEVLPNNILNIEALAVDANALSVDTLSVKVWNLNKSETINLTLVESNSNSGRFRGNIQLSDLTNQTLSKLKADYGDTICVQISDSPAIQMRINVTIPKSPLLLNNLNFMSSNYSEILTGNITPGATLYIEANGIDANELTTDTVVVLCTSTIDQSGILIILKESGTNTGKYRGIVKLDIYSDTASAYLKAYNPLDIISITNICSVPILSDTVMIQGSTSPEIILSINFKDSAFSTTLQRDFLLNEMIYIEAAAVDANPNTVDTLAILLCNVTKSETIILSLTETNSNSGKYRSTAQFGILTNQTQHILQAGYADLIKIFSADASSIYASKYMTDIKAPTALNNLQFMTSNYNTIFNSDTVLPNSTLYIEANGTDGEPLTTDELNCTVTAMPTGETIKIKLIETGVNTGKYRGIIQLKDITNESLGYIKAGTGDTITITACAGGTLKTDTVVIETYSSATDIILSAGFKDQHFTNYITDEIVPDTDIFMEIVKIDPEPDIINNLTLFLINKNIDSSNPSCSIPVVLTETSKNSGIFRNSAKLGLLTNITLRTLQASFGDIIILIYNGWSDTLYVTRPAMPTFISNLNFMIDDYSRELTDNDLILNSTLHIEVNGADGNQLTTDTVNCQVFSTYLSETDSINVILHETGNNTGKYRGTLIFKNYSDDTQDYIKAITTGNTIVVSVINPATSTKLYDTAIIKVTNLFIDDLNYNHIPLKTTNTKNITITGTIGNPSVNCSLLLYNSERNDTITINNYTGNSTFSYNINFQSEGHKLLIFTAVSANNVLQPTSQSIELNIDITPPNLIIISPLNGQYISGASFNIIGKLNHFQEQDTAKIIVNNNEQYTVSLDNIDTKIFSCSIPVLSIHSGDTIKLEIVASDFVGNTVSKTIFLNYTDVNVSIKSISTETSVCITDTTNITNISFGSAVESMPTYSNITLIGDNNEKIKVEFSFTDTGIPLLLVIKKASEIENKIKINEEAENSVKKFCNEALYNAGLKTVREFCWIQNGTLLTAPSIFKNIKLIFDVPIEFKNLYYKIYYFNEIKKLWEPLDESKITRNNIDNTITASLTHFSIYGVFPASELVHQTLNDVVIFPNPFRPNDGNPLTGEEFVGSPTAENLTGIHIKNLTGNNVIEIYTLNGQLVNEITTKPNQARVIWDGKTSNGDKCVSGLYLILIKGQNEKVIKKLTIIR